MKFFLEMCSAFIVGIVFAIVARVMNIEMTGVQFAILGGSTAFTVYITMEISSAILKNREAKKSGQVK